MRRFVWLVSLLLAGWVSQACTPAGQEASPGEERPSAVPQPSELASPASAGSEEPNLAAGPDGRVHLMWFEPQGERWVLLLSSLDPVAASAGRGGEAWSAPTTVSDREHLVNWADFPSVLALEDGRIAVHYSVRSRDPLQAGVHVSWSEDGGASWSEPVIPHRPRSEVPGAPGFVSLIPWSDGSVGVVWLTESRQSTLRFATAGPDGIAGETVVDDLACDCCQTSAAMTSAGPVVVYRDRSPEEIRDISIIRHVDGGWTAPATVHQDGWEIGACPVNGPMVDAEGAAVAVAWFTAAGDVPRVKVAFSEDAGASFGEAIQMDDGSPSGRVAVQLVGPGEAVVSWLERTGDGAEVRVRRVRADGSTSASTTVAASAATNASGFPRMALAGDQLVFAWTDTGGDAPQVRTAIVQLPAVGR